MMLFFPSSLSLSLSLSCVSLASVLLLSCLSLQSLHPSSQIQIAYIMKDSYGFRFKSKSVLRVDELAIRVITKQSIKNPRLHIFTTVQTRLRQKKNVSMSFACSNDLFDFIHITILYTMQQKKRYSMQFN